MRSWPYACAAQQHRLDICAVVPAQSCPCGGAAPRAIFSRGYQQSGVSNTPARTRRMAGAIGTSVINRTRDDHKRSVRKKLVKRPPFDLWSLESCPCVRCIHLSFVPSRPFSRMTQMSRRSVRPDGMYPECSPRVPRGCLRLRCFYKASKSTFISPKHVLQHGACRHQQHLELASTLMDLSK